MLNIKAPPSPAIRARPARVLPGRALAAGGLFLLAVLLSLPWWGSSSQMRTLVEFIYFLALAQMWNLLAGYGGMVSFGQQAWIGLGGYTLIILADDLHVNMFLAVVAGGLVTALVALPTAALAFRLRGGYFAVGTWVIAEVFRLLIGSSTKWLQGESGRTLTAAASLARPLREQYTYWLAVVIGAGSILLVYILMRSRIGLGLTAIRDSETAALSLGVRITRIKLLVFIVAAFGTGIIGGLIYLNALRITPLASFNIQWSAYMAFIVVIGGLGSVEGPLLGTLVFFVFRHYLSNLGPWSLILLGVTAIIMVLIAPQGLWGLIQHRFGFELFAIRRRLPGRLTSEQPPPAHGASTTGEAAGAEEPR